MAGTAVQRIVCTALACALACTLGGCAASSSSESGESIEGLDELGEVTVVAREEGSGTRSVFSEQVGLIVTDDSGVETDVTTSDATVCNDAESVIAAVAADTSAIGYVSLGALDEDSGVKVITVDGVEPSTDTVQDGSYALSRSFYIAYVGQSSEVEADFLSYILTAGQDVVSAEGYVSVTATQRFLSDGSEGFITVSGSTSVAPLMEALAAAYEELNPNASITVTATDSTTGLTAAMTQESDWGMSSRKLESYESELLETSVIAEDAVAVIVNENSPVTSLTQEQLRQLFSGEASTWADLNS